MKVETSGVINYHYNTACKKRFANIHCTQVMSKKKATILTPENLKKRQRKLPNSWTQARGVLEDHDIDPVLYQKEARSDQDSQQKLAKSITE